MSDITTRTVSDLVHSTSVTGCDGLRDGGRARLVATHDLIHEKPDAKTGKLTVNYSQGSITSLVFEERLRVPQSKLDRIDAEDSQRGKAVVTLVQPVEDFS